MVPRGETNVSYLHEHGVSDLGRVGRRARRSRPGVRQAVARLDARRMGATSISSRVSCEQIKTNPNSRRLRGERLERGRARAHGACSHATRCFSSTSPRGGCPASSISAAPMPCSVCRSISPPMRCSRTWSRSNAISSRGSSSGRAAIATCTLNHLEQADLQLSRTPYPLPELVLAAARRACSSTHSRISNSAITGITRQSKRRLPFDRCILDS